MKQIKIGSAAKASPTKKASPVATGLAQLQASLIATV
ncbi:hypothetical protein LCGC14_2303950, partial [marine sediment metagenome]